MEGSTCLLLWFSVHLESDELGTYNISGLGASRLSRRGECQLYGPSATDRGPWAMTTLGLLVCPESVQEEVERTRKGDRMNYQQNSSPLNTVYLPQLSIPSSLYPASLPDSSYLLILDLPPSEVLYPATSESSY
jgi:hypothetical protein